MQKFPVVLGLSWVLQIKGSYLPTQASQRRIIYGFCLKSWFESFIFFQLVVLFKKFRNNAFFVLILKYLPCPLVPTTVLCMRNDIETAFPSRCCCPKKSAQEVKTFSEPWSYKVFSENHVKLSEQPPQCLLPLWSSRRDQNLNSSKPATLQKLNAHHFVGQCFWLLHAIRV